MSAQLTRTVMAAVLYLLAGTAPAAPATATFAGGCFWCMEPPFDKLNGVTATVSGYANGHVANPSYKQVVAGGTGHYEAVQVSYDDSKVSYQQLLEIYWANIDPLDGSGQFCDRGDSYRAAIFYHDAQQQQLAEQSLTSVLQHYLPAANLVTPVVALTAFYPAEDYHQDFYINNPKRYKVYRWGCGRDRRLQALWGERQRLELFAPDSQP